MPVPMSLLPERTRRPHLVGPHPVHALGTPAYTIHTYFACWMSAADIGGARSAQRRWPQRGFVVLCAAAAAFCAAPAG
jgi:hypothetical protein